MMEQEQALWGLGTDLAYFAAMQESQPKDRPDHSAKKWDQRAEAWEKERREKQKGDARVRSAVAYLEKQGLLQPDFHVADVGCGPGRFAVAFARRVRWVAGFDLSPRMIHYGLEYARREGVANLTLQALDFQTLEVEAAGLRRAFDLVFSSLTPAVHGQAGLEKMMDMSRAYCCNITHLYHRNSICRQLQEEVFGIPPVSPWGGRWFYSLFNLLLLRGYLPQTSYDRQLEARRFVPSQDYAAMLLERVLPPAERTEKNQACIFAWLQAHTDGEGMLTETSEACYGRILWDVRDRISEAG